MYVLKEIFEESKWEESRVPERNTRLSILYSFNTKAVFTNGSSNVRKAPLNLRIESTTLEAKARGGGRRIF